MRKITLTLVLSLLLPQIAFSQSAEEQVVAQLRAQGYSEFQVSRTLLGRLRVIAETDDLRRELVINTATGTVLRDVVQRRASGDDRVIVPDRVTGEGASARDDVREAVEDALEERQDTREDRREDIKDAIEDARDAREDRQEARDEAREDRQEAREERREDRQDAREERREDRDRDDRDDDD